MSYKIGCRSYGLEMENVRHLGSKEVLFLLSADPLLKGPWVSKVFFECGNATDTEAFIHPVDDSSFTHIYSYNKLMSDNELKAISKILNKSDFKVLAWSKNQHQTEVSGLMDYEFIGQLPMKN